MKRFRPQKGFHLTAKLLVERLDSVRSIYLFHIEQGALLERKLFQKLFREQHAVAISDLANFGLHAFFITELYPVYKENYNEVITT